MFRRYFSLDIHARNQQGNPEARRNLCIQSTTGMQGLLRRSSITLTLLIRNTIQMRSISNSCNIWAQTSSSGSSLT
jgi:hypothetical protein